MTASLNGTPRTVTLTLTAPVTLSGLVAAYAMNEGTGSTLTDVSGNGNHGVIYGAAWTTGKYGSALSFNGSTSYVDLGNATSLQMSGSMTLSAWVKLASSPARNGQIIAKADDVSGWQLKSNPNYGNRSFGVGVSPNSTSRTLRYTSLNPGLNTWYYVAAIFNGASGAMDVYVNGVLSNGSLSGSIPSSQYNNAGQAVTIGRRSGGYYFKGVIDELRVYNRALSPAEVAADMNTALTSTAPAVMLSLRGKPSSMDGQPLNLEVSASGAGQLPVTLSASGLPAGANFDGQTGAFSWDPAGAPAGSYPVRFSATDAAGATDSTEVVLDVVSGAPVVEGLFHSVTEVSGSACTSGGLASLRASGLGTNPDDVRVLVNGADAAIVSLAANRLQFVCPDAPAGTPLRVQVQRGAFASNTVEDTMVETAPGILPSDGPRSATASGSYEVLAVGLNGQAQARLVIGGVPVAAEVVKTGVQGIWRVTAARIPDGIQPGEELPVTLEVLQSDGSKLTSNMVFLSVRE